VIGKVFYNYPILGVWHESQRTAGQDQIATVIHDRGRWQVTHLDVARDLGALEVVGHLLRPLKIPLEEQHGWGHY